MNPVAAALKSWRDRRAQLALDQLKNPVEGGHIAGHPKAAAIQGLTRAKSHTDWAGD
jgi:hypothetical protein